MEETAAVRRQIRARRLTRVLLLIAVCSIATTTLLSKLAEHSYRHQEARLLAQLAAAPDSKAFLNGPVQDQSIAGQLRGLRYALGPVRRVVPVSMHGVVIPGFLPGYVNAQYRIVCARGSSDAEITAQTTSYRYDNARILSCWIHPQGFTPLGTTKPIVIWGW